MQNLSLKTNTGESLTLQVPTSWYEVTVSQYAEIYDKPLYEQMAMLIKLEYSRFMNIEINSPGFVALLTYMEFLTTNPENNDTAFPKNIGKQSIGQFELCKKYINLYGDKSIWHLAPYIYVIYMMTDKYNPVEVFTMGMPKKLLDEVRNMSIIEVYSPVNFFLSNLNGLEKSITRSLMSRLLLNKLRRVLKRLTCTVFSVR